MEFIKLIDFLKNFCYNGYRKKKEGILSESCNAASLLC